MSDLFQRFGGSTKEEWLAKVTIDLKGKPLESLNFSLFEQIDATPFAHRDDVQEEINIPLPHLDHTVLGYEVVVRDAAESNVLILEALSGGASYLKLSIAEDREIDFKRLFDGVMIDLIHLDLTMKDKTHLDKLLNYLCCTYKEEVFQNVSIHEQSSPNFISQKTSLGLVESPSIDSLSAFVAQSSSELIKEKLPKTFEVAVSVGHNYIETICLIRAVRLLWSNVLAAHDYSLQDYPLLVTGSIAEKAIENVKYDNMIAFTQMITAMISAGIDIVMIPPSDVKEEERGSEFSRRISRNIYHLLDQESHMMKVSDPAAGSYFFDQMTVEVAEMAWDMFIKERN